MFCLGVQELNCKKLNLKKILEEWTLRVVSGM